MANQLIPYCDCMRKKGEFVQRCSTFVGDQRETVNCSAAVHHISFSCWIVWEVSQIVKYFEQVAEHSSKAPQLQRRKPGQGEQFFTSQIPFLQTDSHSESLDFSRLLISDF